ncbi:MAG: DUF2029 domain-containing protein [Acidobacteria bacterium]|nr:DUF2029 domain-containing protein [Acidobacteriota bacterium]
MINGRALGWTNLSFVALGCVLLVLYRLGLHAKGSESILWFIKLALAQGIIYLVATYLILRARPARSTLFLIILFAALFRLSILFAPPYLSSDIYRYVWDGRVQAAGINPYRYIPADEPLAGLRDEEIYSQINRRDYAHTIYPPGAQIIYFLATRASESVTWMKAFMIGFEALTLYALIQLLASFNLPVQRVLLYAWHPLVVWEFAGSGHVDAAMIAFIALALLARRRNSEVGTGLALAGATLIKYYPVILFPALYRRWSWKMPVAFVLTIVLAYLPYLSAGLKVLGFLPNYTEEEGLQNGTRFYLLNLARRAFGEAKVPNAAFIIFALLIMAAVAVWSLRGREKSDKSYVARAFVLASAFTLLLSPRYSWYFAWLVPFLCLMPLAPFLLLTTAHFVLYALWIEDTASTGFTLNTFVFLPFAIVSMIALWKRRAAKRRKDKRDEVAGSLEEGTSQAKFEELPKHDTG